MTKEYLGDGVYAEPGDYLGEVILSTSNGIEDTNRIVVDPTVARKIIAYLQSTLTEAQE